MSVGISAATIYFVSRANLQIVPLTPFPLSILLVGLIAKQMVLVDGMQVVRRCVIVKMGSVRLAVSN